MKQKNDVRTAEIPGLKRPVGRPPTGNAMTGAERIRLMRQRRAELKRAVSIELGVDVKARLDEYRQFKDETESQVIERILRNQLMRKR